MNKFWSWLADFVKKNLPSIAGVLSIIGTSILLLGGIFAIIVSAKNGYLPDVNFVDMTTTLFAIAVVGVVAIVSIAIVLFYSVLPVVFIKPNLNIRWNQFVFLLPSLLTVLYLAFLIFLPSHPLSVQWFLIGMLVTTILCLFLRSFLCSFFNWFKNIFPCVLEAKVVATCTNIIRKYSPIIKDSWRVFLSGVVLCGGLFLAAFIILKMLSEQQDDFNKKLLFLNFIIVWGSVNFGLINLILNKKIKVLSAILFIFLIPLLMSFWAGNVAMVPTATFQLLGMGGIPVTLALKEDTCITLEQQADSDSIRCHQGIMENVMLKSRIGGWFMVEPILSEKNNGDNHGDVRKFFIRKEDVKFWIRERKKTGDGAAGNVEGKGVSEEPPKKSKINNPNQ